MNTEFITYRAIGLTSLLVSAVISWLHYQGKLKLLQEKISQLISGNQSLVGEVETSKNQISVLSEQITKCQIHLEVEKERYSNLREQYDKEVNDVDTRLLQLIWAWTIGK